MPGRRPGKDAATNGERCTMKKVLPLLLAVFIILCSANAMAAPAGYGTVGNYMCEDFEDADNSMIGNNDSPVARAFDKHDMDPYYFADGTMEITDEGQDGSKGLKLIPDYYSDLPNGTNVIMRTQLQRVCATLDDSKREEVLNAWAEAAGFSFYVKNVTETDIICIPGLHINLANGSTMALGAGLSTMLVETDGTTYEPDFVSGWVNTAIYIPAEFEGWVVLKNEIGVHEDWDTGWGVQPWEDENKINAEGASFANAAFFQIDFRLGVSGLDDTGYIVVDSFELLSNAEPVPSSGSTTPADDNPTGSAEAQPSENSEGSSPVGIPDAVLTAIIVAAVVVIAAVILLVVILNKRKQTK